MIYRCGIGVKHIILGMVLTHVSSVWAVDVHVVGDTVTIDGHEVRR